MDDINYHILLTVYRLYEIPTSISINKPMFGSKFLDIEDGIIKDRLISLKKQNYLQITKANYYSLGRYGDKQFKEERNKRRLLWIKNNYVMILAIAAAICGVVKYLVSATWL